MESPKQRARLRWFHLRIRDLLTLTLICAILAAWWTDRMRLKDKANRAEELAEQLKADADVANASALSNREKAARYDAVYDEIGLVEVNRGSDDGLKKGDILEVMRRAKTPGGSPIARIRLIVVERERAVGTPLPGNGAIQKGDWVFPLME